MIERDRKDVFEAEVRESAAALGNELEVHHLESADSTNTWALDHLEARESPGPSAVVADRQLAGRGQHGRSWFAVGGGSLALTYVPRLSQRGLEAPCYSMAAAVAAREVLAPFLDRPPRLKWPNDLLVHSRKLAGILVESRTIGARHIGPVIGIGVNLDLALEAFPAELRDQATSLRIEGASCPSRGRLAGQLARAFDTRLDRALAGASRELCEHYLLGLELRDREVRVEAGGGALEGTLIDLDLAAGVVLRCAGRRIAVPLAQIRALREAAST